MTTIFKGDFVFSADVEKTKKYYLTNTVCKCSSCRNLYAQIKNLFPQLTSFLMEFGIDISRPDESADIIVENHIDYLLVGYTVVGSLQTDGQYETDIENLHITISSGKTPYDWFPNEQTEPCFYISITGISLPWVLDEPFPHSKRIIDRIKCFFRKKSTH